MIKKVRNQTFTGLIFITARLGVKFPEQCLKRVFFRQSAWARKLHKTFNRKSLFFLTPSSSRRYRWRPLSMSTLMIKIVRSEVLAGLALITAGLAADPAVVSAQQTGQAQGQ